MKPLKSDYYKIAGISEVPMLAAPGFTKWAFIMPIIH
jgi:hypothetical protein